MEIPFKELTSELLRAIIVEFVTREGTDYGPVEYSLDEKIVQVRSQLEKGEAKIVFDEKTETCSVVSR